MPIRKRGDVYWIDIRLPGGERLRRSAGTSDRKEAQEYHDKVKAEAWRVAKLGEKPSRTFAEAAVRYLTEQSGSKDYESKERHILHFRESFRGEALDKERCCNAGPFHWLAARQYLRSGMVAG